MGKPPWTCQAGSDAVRSAPAEPEASPLEPTPHPPHHGRFLGLPPNSGQLWGGQEGLPAVPRAVSTGLQRMSWDDPPNGHSADSRPQDGVGRGSRVLVPSQETQWLPLGTSVPELRQLGGGCSGSCSRARAPTVCTTGAVMATLRPAAAPQGTSRHSRLFQARHLTLSLLVRDSVGSVGHRTQAGTCSSLPHSRRGLGTTVGNSLGFPVSLLFPTTTHSPVSAMKVTGERELRWRCGRRHSGR